MATTPKNDRNIIVILFDDVSARKFKLFNDGQAALYGGTVFNTPNMDAEWEKRGKAFPCVVHPICGATRGAFLTGKHNFKTGNLNIPNHGTFLTTPSSINGLFQHRGTFSGTLDEASDFYLGKYASTLQIPASSTDSNIMTVARYLKDNYDYKTAIFGKSHTSPNYRYLHNHNLGFTYFKGHIDNIEPPQGSYFDYITWGFPWNPTYAAVSVSGPYGYYYSISPTNATATSLAAQGLTSWESWGLGLSGYTGSSTGYGVSGRSHYAWEEIESFDDGTYDVTYVSGTFQELDLKNAYSSYYPLGYIPSAVKFTPVSSYSNIPEVYAKCENFSSDNQFNGIYTSATFPSRGKKLGYDNPNYWAGRCIEDCVEWVKDRQEAGENYFAWVNPTAPHDPHQIPPVELLTPSSQVALAARGLNTGYYSSADVLNSNRYMYNLPSGNFTDVESGYWVMEALDTMIGKLFKTVNWDNTDIYILSDNGDESNMAELPDDGDARNTKRYVSLHGLQVPLLVYSDKIRDPGTYSTKLVTEMDLFSTIVESLETSSIVQYPFLQTDSSSFYKFIETSTYESDANSYRKYCYLEIGGPHGTSGTASLERTIVQRDPTVNSFSGPYYQLYTRNVGSNSTFGAYTASTVSAGLFSWTYSGSGVDPLDSTTYGKIPVGGLLFYYNDEFTLSGIVPSALKNAYDSFSKPSGTDERWLKFLELSGYYTQETGRTFNISTLEWFG